MIIKLMGGLGNQLFQYAYGRAQSLEKNEPLYLDTTWYKGRLNRTYLLNHFNINANQLGFLRKLFTNKKNIIVDEIGAWHEEKYFKKHEDIIKSELTLRNPLSTKNSELLSQIQGINSVSIHLRGTDYVRGNKSSYHGTCSPDYYKEAIRLIRGKVSNPHFYIFTDDIPWAKDYLAFPEPHTIVSDPTNPPHEELILMSGCKHNIIANSTFSWWAAWLNANQEKIVIAPKEWFADKEAAQKSKIVLPSWIQI